MKSVPLTVAFVTPQGTDALRIEFKNSQPINFKSGQYLTLNAEINGKSVYRSYSICQAPQRGALAIGVRVLPNGLFSRWLGQNARTGFKINASYPLGTFLLRESPKPQGHNLFIASGSGITPIISLLEDYLFRFPERKATLLYGNRKNSTTMFLDSLLELKNRFIERLEIHFFTSQEKQATDWQSLRLDGETLRILLQKRLMNYEAFTHIYLCGPTAMMEDNILMLQKLNVDPENIFSERFSLLEEQPKPEKTPPCENRPKTSRDQTIVAKIATIFLGIEHTFEYMSDDHSILDAAHRNGIELPHSCSAGVCGTCRTKIVEGKVSMKQNYALDSEDLEHNFILACRSKPETPQVTLNFDY